MTIRWAIVVLVGLLFAPAYVSAQARPAPAAAAPSVAVKVGARKSFSVPNLSRVAVGNPDVADIKVAAGDMIEVIGRSAGTTEVQVWKQDGGRLSYVVVVSR